MRKLLLKIAHKILKKYGLIPLCFQDKVLFMGKIYEIQSCDISKDFYNCPYVDVIPFRNGNEYDEAYRCAVTRKSCQGCACKLSTEECERLVREQKN